MIITSAANERVKAIRKLQERKARQESGLFYVEGLRLVGEASQSGAPIDTMIYAPDLLSSDFGRQVLVEQEAAGVEILEVGADLFRRMAMKDNPQGIAAVVRQKWVSLSAVKPQAGQSWVALDSVADPGNLGTILRTHDAVGGVGVILLDQSTDPYDPSSVRASMGALFAQQLVKCSLAEFTEWKAQTGVALIGTSGAAEQDYHAYRYPSPLVVLMGSERQGLLPEHLALCDEVVSIPMRAGGSDSLNLAVAAAVVLYEIHNQRREK